MTDAETSLAISMGLKFVNIRIEDKAGEVSVALEDWDGRHWRRQTIAMPKDTADIAEAGQRLAGLARAMKLDIFADANN